MNYREDILQVPSQNAPWRGQMAKAWRAVKHVKDTITFIGAGRYESGLSDYGTFRGATVHVPTVLLALQRRERWHREWYEYGKRLRLPPR